MDVGGSDLSSKTGFYLLKNRDYVIPEFLQISPPRFLNVLLLEEPRNIFILGKTGS